ncbi:hypothetical protein [Arthrobacter sp. HLT1-21]
MNVKLSTDELTRELASRQQDQLVEAARWQDQLTTAQDRWCHDLLERYQELEVALVAEGETAMTVATAALRARDFTTAWDGYLGWHVSRAARNTLRSGAQNAANRVPYNGPAIPDLRYADFDFAGWLNSEGSKIVGESGVDRCAELIGEMPATIADLTT